MLKCFVLHLVVYRMELHLQANHVGIRKHSLQLRYHDLGVQHMGVLSNERNGSNLMKATLQCKGK